MIAADQMIRNLSMKIGEVDSGSARLLAAHSNLAEPKSTSPIFMLEISYHLVAAEGGQNRRHLLPKNTILQYLSPGITRLL